MKHVIAMLCLFGLFATHAHALEEPEKLAKAKNCTVCHAADKKIVGPSYRDVTAKRGGQKGAEAALAAKIKNGSQGEWGAVVMQANNVTDAEAAVLAKWVLSHK